jgi:hypothetical protein
MLSMKRPLLIAGVALGLVMLVCVAVGAWKLFTITDPYLVKPLTSSPAPVGASVGTWSVAARVICPSSVAMM